MTAKFQRRHGAAIFDYTLTKRQIDVEVRGLFTPCALKSLAQGISRVSTHLLATSIVVDMRTAALVLTYDDIVIAPEYLSKPMQLLPIALLPPAPGLEIYREYAWAQAKVGLLHGVFEDKDRALAWTDQKGRRIDPRAVLAAK